MNYSKGTSAVVLSLNATRWPVFPNIISEREREREREKKKHIIIRPKHNDQPALTAACAHFLSLFLSLRLSVRCCVCLSLSQPHIHRWWHSVRINKSSSLGRFHSFSLPSHGPTHTHAHGHTSCRPCCLSPIDREERPFFFFSSSSSLMNTVNTNRTTICLCWRPFSFSSRLSGPRCITPQ